MSYPRYANKNSTLQSSLANNSCLIDCFLQAYAPRAGVEFWTGQVSVELTETRRAVDSQQGASLVHLMFTQWQHDYERNAELTARTNQPVSAFLDFASRWVFERTWCTLDNGGLGRGCGLRRVSNCLIGAGRCLTISSDTLSNELESSLNKGSKLRRSDLDRGDEGRGRHVKGSKYTPSHPCERA